MQRVSSPKILRQRAVAVALLLSAVLAVAAVTITALGSGADSGARAGVEAQFFSWPHE